MSCEGGECEASRELARTLVDSGFRKVLVYTGGFPEWAASGYAVTGSGTPAANSAVSYVHEAATGSDGVVRVRLRRIVVPTTAVPSATDSASGRSDSRIARLHLACEAHQRAAYGHASGFGRRLAERFGNLLIAQSHFDARHDRLALFLP